MKKLVSVGTNLTPITQVVDKGHNIRAIVEQHVEDIFNNIAENGYVAETGTLAAIQSEDGVHWVIDGNHRLRAIKKAIEAGILPEGFQVPVSLYTFEGDITNTEDLRDAINFYQTGSTQGPKRNFNIRDISEAVAIRSVRTNAEGKPFYTQEEIAEILRIHVWHVGVLLNIYRKKFMGHVPALHDLPYTEAVDVVNKSRHMTAAEMNQHLETKRNLELVADATAEKISGLADKKDQLTTEKKAAVESFKKLNETIKKQSDAMKVLEDEKKAAKGAEAKQAVALKITAAKEALTKSEKEAAVYENPKDKTKGSIVELSSELAKVNDEIKRLTDQRKAESAAAREATKALKGKAPSTKTAGAKPSEKAAEPAAATDGKFKPWVTFKTFIEEMVASTKPVPQNQDVLNFIKLGLGADSAEDATTYFNAVFGYNPTGVAAKQDDEDDSQAESQPQITSSDQIARIEEDAKNLSAEALLGGDDENYMGA